MRVQDQLISPRYGGPIIGALRDFITGAYLLTKDDTTLTPQEFANLAMMAGYNGAFPEPATKGRGNPMYTGKQLFSLFLPKDFNYVITSKWSKGTKGPAKDVVIKNGQLVSGVIDKASIGAEEPDSVLHRITKDYGYDEAKKFLNSILVMLKQFITHYGFSYGYSDLELSTKTKENILGGIQETYDKVYDLISQAKKGTLQLSRGLSADEALEAYIVNELSKARDRAGSLADKSFDEKKAGRIMENTGAQGPSQNLRQIDGTLAT